MGKHSAMTEKQNKLNKELMKESVTRKNNDSMLSIRYDETIINTRKAYSMTNDSYKYDHCSIFHTLECELAQNRYTIIIDSDTQAHVWFKSDNFRLDIEKKNIEKKEHFVFEQKYRTHIAYKYINTCIFTCTLSHSLTSKTHTFPPMSSIYDVIDKIEHITRMWDYEMFCEIAQ